MIIMDDARQVVRDYLDGITFADEARIRRAFHPDGKLIGYKNGVLEWDSVEKFINDRRAAGTLSERAPYYWEIVLEDQTEDIATVKVIDEYRESRYTYYIVLLYIDGRWQIVSKVFHRHL
ncbi:nuclear transport factor 2 family protein [Aquibium sp. LZ166]|uniref:Nuclear transport factor 2 family protein n=1 Tax=Aquibium pacificus TaxID=3153579 RepID=A0ABV3SSF1_9HYPH